MKTRFYKTGELNGSNYVKILSGSNAILNIKNHVKLCFTFSILASIHPCNIDNPNRV